MRGIAERTQQSDGVPRGQDKEAETRSSLQPGAEIDRHIKTIHLQWGVN